MVAACSTSPGGGAKYYFSEDEVDFVKHGEGYLGEMWGSMGGTRWGLYDDGVDGGILEEMEQKQVSYKITWLVPCESSSFSNSSQRVLLIYDTNVLGRVPNAMRVVVPRPGVSTSTHRNMHSAWQKNKAEFLEVRTKKPKWNARMEAWTMDFKGRAKLASKKNFILIDPDDEDERVLMLFGKMTKNRWSLDFSPPLNPITCLFVAVTAFSSKMVVT